MPSIKEFESWLKGECPAPADQYTYRELHLIPNVDLSFECFPEFIEARVKLMRERLAEMLGVTLRDQS